MVQNPLQVPISCAMTSKATDSGEISSPFHTWD